MQHNVVSHEKKKEKTIIMNTFSENIDKRKKNRNYVYTKGKDSYHKMFPSKDKPKR